MKISKHSLILKDSKTDILFNALSRYEIEIDNKLLTALRCREFHRIDEHILSELIEMRFIVSDDCDEKKYLMRFLSDETSQTKTLDVTYAMTYNCNMSCTYCVQSAFEAENECDNEAFIDWLSNHLDTANPESLRISFFGGEPLLRAESISKISSEIHKRCKNRAIKFGFSITTNGTLINIEKARKWKRQGLIVKPRVKLTPDGVEN